MSKYLKNLCCDHFLNHLHEKFNPNSYFKVNDKFYECSHSVQDHEFVVVKFHLCRFNFSNGFQRDYYASATCCCKSKFRTDASVFCKRRERELNLKVLKICMEKKRFSSL